jgi:hypothetical protein
MTGPLRHRNRHKSQEEVIHSLLRHDLPEDEAPEYSHVRRNRDALLHEILDIPTVSLYAYSVTLAFMEPTGF